MANQTDREIVQQLDQAFAALIVSLKDLAPSVPSDLLLRSAAAIEQMCGGLTSNLWDDPFEWTLPETLSNADRIIEYLSEVDLARQRAFNAISDDSALRKLISVPSGESRLLISLLLETLVKASEFRGRATVQTKKYTGLHDVQH
ncbi:MAG TPA: hypothetical protein VKB02_08655 [Pyrinomonadaceae bacterium]|nr:hypothetical protein [Pyrinomonadaceae bacterium]